MNFKTIDDLNKTIFNNINKIPTDVDLIVGIPRSGMLVANLISLYLNLPLTDFDSLLNGRIFKCGSTKRKDNWISSIKEARKILIVEDSSKTGTTFKNIKEKLKDFKYKDKITILTAYVTDETKKMTDLYFEVCNPPRVFEWNLYHVHALNNFCFDIDGVLCPDPTEEQNDDGENYKKFIRNIQPKIIPTFAIGWLVTSRLEKYREDTEYWLNKNNIKYNNLIMMQFDTKEERILSGSHGSFKGNNYKKLKDATLFVESSFNQAIDIARISGKTVYCTENHKVIDASSSYKIKEKTQYGKEKLKRKIKQIIKAIIRKK